MVLALPLRLAATGALDTRADGSPGEIGQSVAVLLSTRVGERRCEPTYGSADPLGSPVRAVDVDARALARWEDRATDEVVQVQVHALFGGVT